MATAFEPLSRAADRTAADDRHVREVNLEASLPVNRLDDRSSAALGDLLGAPALSAVQVTVFDLREHVELLSPVVAVVVADKAQILEYIQRAVHRRTDRRGVSAPTLLDKLDTGHVTVRCSEDVDEGSALRGPP